jgi:putative hydrolase of the HAD superfamily
LFDFGGVISTSPFESFARYEQANGLPDGFLRRLNSTNPDTNAWALHERNEIDFAEFCRLYEAEAIALGGQVVASEVIACLSGEIRPEMVHAIHRCRERLRTGLITNNMAAFTGSDAMDAMAELFDVVIESSKAGVRKPDPRIYEMACEQLEVTPNEVVFLDDLGVNLKPARAIGMTTIKVLDVDEALGALETAVGFSVR